MIFLIVKLLYYVMSRGSSESEIKIYNYSITLIQTKFITLNTLQLDHIYTEGTMNEYYKTKNKKV
jgi:hypothetical protein